MKISCIYSIVNLVNNKIYIGSAVNFRGRKAKHLHLLRLNKHNAVLQNAWNKYKEENFEFQILELVKNKAELISREQVWFDFFNPEYNILKKADSNLGMKHSGKTKKLLSEKLKGRIGARLGHKLTPEQRIQCGNANRGKKYSKEINLKKGLKGEKNPFFGKTHSEETKKKWSIKRMGAISPNKGKKASAELLKKLSDSHKGQKRSPETIEKFKESMKVVKQEKLTMIF